MNRFMSFLLASVFFLAAVALPAQWLSGAEVDVLKLRTGRSLTLRAKADVYRTAVVDAAVCDIVQFKPRELLIVGRASGQTQVTFWFNGPGMEPLSYVIDVQ